MQNVDSSKSNRGLIEPGIELLHVDSKTDNDEETITMEMSAVSRHEEVVDEGFFSANCKEIEITPKIGKIMIIDFVKSSQLFSKI